MDVYKNRTIPYRYMPNTYLKDEHDIASPAEANQSYPHHQEDYDKECSCHMCNHHCEKDKEYFYKMMSPLVKEISPHVHDMCDKMEYEGNIMYQDYPDANYFCRMCDELHYKVRHLEQDSTVVYSMQRHTSNQNPWLRSVIELMLFDEIRHRRRRRRHHGHGGRHHGGHHGGHHGYGNVVIPY